MKSTLCCLFILLAQFVVGQSGNEINYTVEDGLPSNNVYCVEQDDRGFMWFGTDAGLSRFDGYEFKNYSLADGLPDTEILNFYKDSKGRIWMYTLNGKVGYIQKDSIYTSLNDEYLRDADFTHRIAFVQEVAEGMVISSYKGEISLIAKEDTYTLDTHSIFGYIWYCNDKFYFQNHELMGESPISNLYTFSVSDQGIEPLVKVQEFHSDNLRYWQTYVICNEAFALSSAMAPRKQLNFFDLSNLTYKKIDVPFQVLNLQLRDEGPILMTDLGMYQFYMNSELQRINNYESVSDAHIDSEKNQWITSLKNGIFFESRGIVRDVEEELENVRALYEKDSQLYITSLNKVSVLDSSNRLVKKFSYNNDWVIYFLLEEKSDFLYGSLGLFLNGLDIKNRIRKGVARVGAVTNTTLIVSGIDKISFFSTNDYSKPVKISRHNLGLINDVHLFSEDSFLIASDLGLHLWCRGSISEFSSNPFFSDRIYQIEYDDDNNLWIATDGNGLLRYDGEETLQFSIGEGLLSDVCNNLLVVASNIYVTTPRGISKIESRDTDYAISQITKEDGLRSYAINDIELFNNRIYLAQDDGLIYFDADETFLEESDFPLFIDRVSIGNQVINHTEKGNLPHNVESIQIAYKGLRYRNHNNLSYQYNLNGLYNDQLDWVDTKLNSITYSNIQPGEYTFQVRAKTKNSNWTKPISYQFTVQTALWQKSWFQVLMYLLGIGISLVLYKQFLKNNESKRMLSHDKLKAEVRALKAQINPHFLFNALNSIQSFILEDEKNIAQDYLVKYGQLMRKILDHSNELTVPLNEELEALHLYVELEQLRVKQGFAFEVHVNESIDSYITNVPSMVIQPFLENAIWHGVSPLKEKGKITLSLTLQDELVEVQIVDNGVGFDIKAPANAKHTSKGVQLVRERLELLKESEGEESVLEMQSEIGKGTTVLLRFSNDLS